MTPNARDTFCSHCGARHENVASYPRTCPSCKVSVWANPIPVSVVLLPVHHGGRAGVMVIRRAIQPGSGKLALVGGFLEDHETWAEGGARELREETGVTVDPATLAPFWFTSTEPRPNRVLLFSLAPPLQATELGPFTPDHETAERGLVFGPKGLEDVFAFPLHIRAVTRFFGSERFFGKGGATGPHDFTPV